MMIFDLQPTLENNLILLRPLNQEDYDSLYQVAKDPLIWEQHPCDRSEKNEFEILFKESMAESVYNPRTFAESFSIQP